MLDTGTPPLSARPAVSSPSCQPGLMLANLITFAHFAVSSAMSLLKSAGAPESTVLSKSANHALILGLERAALTSATGVGRLFACACLTAVARSNGTYDLRSGPPRAGLFHFRRRYRSDGPSRSRPTSIGDLCLHGDHDYATGRGSRLPRWHRKPPNATRTEVNWVFARNHYVGIFYK